MLISTNPIWENTRSYVEKGLFICNMAALELDWITNLPVLTAKKRLKVHKYTEQEVMENVDPPGNATGHLASGVRLKDKGARRKLKWKVKKFWKNAAGAQNWSPLRVWIREHEHPVICHTNFPKDNHLQHAWTLPYPPMLTTGFLI